MQTNKSPDDIPKINDVFLCKSHLDLSVFLAKPRCGKSILVASWLKNKIAETENGKEDFRNR